MIEVSLPLTFIHVVFIVNLYCIYVSFLSHCLDFIIQVNMGIKIASMLQLFVSIYPYFEFIVCSKLLSLSIVSTTVCNGNGKCNDHQQSQPMHYQLLCKGCQRCVDVEMEHSHY